MLLVPNAALRFTPPETALPNKKSKGSVLGTLMPRPPASGNRETGMRLAQLVNHPAVESANKVASKSSSANFSSGVGIRASSKASKATL